jgi:hypothetical protein
MDIPPSFQFAKETVTQLITLATAVVGVSVTFAKDIRSKITAHDRRWLFRSWVALLVSVVCGIWALMALTGTLANGEVPSSAIKGVNVKIPSILQILAFLAGIGMLIRDACN